MSLNGMMRTGVSGMNGQSNRLSAVADNIANANTNGYRRARTEFSTLIIPKQKGTSDTVEMLSEEDVLTVHLEKELYPLGWIHTHPTQVWGSGSGRVMSATGCGAAWGW